MTTVILVFARDIWNFFFAAEWNRLWCLMAFPFRRSSMNRKNVKGKLIKKTLKNDWNTLSQKLNFAPNVILKPTWKHLLRCYIFAPPFPTSSLFLSYFSYAFLLIIPNFALRKREELMEKSRVFEREGKREQAWKLKGQAVEVAYEHISGFIEVQ